MRRFVFVVAAIAGLLGVPTVGFGQQSVVIVSAGGDPAGPSFHSYVTEFFRERSGCRERVVPALYDDQASYSVLFEYHSDSRNSVTVWGFQFERPSFGRLVFEASRVGSVAAIVKRVCTFVKREQRRQ